MKKKQEAHSPVPEQPGELFHLCFLRVGGRQGGAEQWAVGFHEFLSQHFLCRLLLQVCASNLPAILPPTWRWSSKMAWHQIRVLRRRRFAVPLPHPSNPRSATARMALLLPPPHPTGPPPCIRPARTQLYKSSLRRPNPRLKPPTPQLLGGWKLENKSLISLPMYRCSGSLRFPLSIISASQVGTRLPPIPSLLPIPAVLYKFKFPSPLP